jgi:hypothetical protein
LLFVLAVGFFYVTIPYSVILEERMEQTLFGLLVVGEGEFITFVLVNT